MELLLNIVQQKIVIEIFCNLCPHLSSPFSSWVKNMFKKKCPCYIVWQNYAYRNSLSNSTAFVLIRMFFDFVNIFRKISFISNDFLHYFYQSFFHTIQQNQCAIFVNVKPSIKIYSMTYPQINNLLYYTSLGVKEKIFES